MLWLVTSLSIASAGSVSGAVSGAAPREQAEQLYTMAEQEEHDLEFGEALEHYEASIALDPSTRYALRARARAGWLHRHAEGGFAPLARLERVRRDSRAQYDDRAMDALAHDLEAFPPGAVRCEARMLVAEAYASRLGRPGDATRELWGLLDEKPACEGPLRAQAATKLTDVAIDQGDLAAARDAAASARNEAPELAPRVARLLRRRFLRGVALGLVALSAALGAWGVVKTVRAGKGAALARFSVRALAICVYLATFGGLLATAFERGHALPFVMLSAATLAIAVLARAASLSGSTSRAARAGRAVLGAVTVLAAALLVLERIDARYLESFGL